MSRVPNKYKITICTLKNDCIYPQVFLINWFYHFEISDFAKLKKLAFLLQYLVFEPAWGIQNLWTHEAQQKITELNLFNNREVLNAQSTITYWSFVNIWETAFFLSYLKLAVYLWEKKTE